MGVPRVTPADREQARGLYGTFVFSAWLGTSYDCPVLGDMDRRLFLDCGSGSVNHHVVYKQQRLEV